MEDYRSLYSRSTADSENFWNEVAEDFYWEKKWSRVRNFNFYRTRGPISISWFEGARTNLSYNCLDRHLAKLKDKAALIWEGNDPEDTRELSYGELHREVCKFANVLRSAGVKRGDCIAIYMPMVPELLIAVLASARIGAVHSVVFGGFSASALADRIVDSKTKVLVTADIGLRGDKIIPLKSNADQAMALAESMGTRTEHCIVYQRSKDRVSSVAWKEGRDRWWHEVMEKASESSPPEWMESEDPLFILYTSGSTGKPKGALHTTAGYMVWAGTTFRYVFDHREDDVHFCTADLGWVTGHTYVAYGPLLNGATTLMFEGIPTWPDPSRFWQIIDRHNVTILYTAPTAIRSLEALGDSWLEKSSRSSLRLLGSVGEPINPAAWLWYHEKVGLGRCPIVDTWWQTETGGILISPLPGAIPTKPGSATLPFFGVEPVVIDAQTGKVLEGVAQGVLAISASWPGQMRTVYGDHKRFEETYFSAYEGFYFTGDGCRRDEDGYYWITGRVDDVLNVSGHRFGTAEIESALVSHASVSEAAVVGYPHPIKGEGIYAYVTLSSGVKESEALAKELRGQVRDKIGAIAAPDVIHWAPSLPKTRSGKIMRRILRKISAGEFDQIGDTTTLADPSVVQQLIQRKPS